MVKHSGVFLLFLALGFLGVSVSQSVQTRLPPEEIESLKSIARAINKTNWDFSVDPCSQESGWVTPNAPIGFENSVWCNNCSHDGSVCHVTSIVLKSQNLVGMLPPDMAKLPFLQEIDLTRNYLYGSIPKDWAVLPLVNLSLLGNRISGKIPSWIGNITTLRKLVLEGNQLTGSLPEQLGHLNSLELFQFSSNFFSGELPDTFANLTNLKYFLIRSNNFNGKIPEFIKNWTQLLRLDLQASGLEGPIPSGISLLKKLDDLRISDIDGNSNFPPLQGIEQLRYLTLRNCGISGEIPNFMDNFVNLQRLDLSYNKLSGKIPATFQNLIHTNVMFLTGNNLSGPVPDWMLTSKNNIDLSYNNFTLDTQDQTCQEGKVNFLGSYLLHNSNKWVPCLETIPCNGEHWSLYINCGGDKVTSDENQIFESDNDGSDGVSTYRVGTNWAISSTGAFLDTGDNNHYIATSRQKLLLPDSQLYANARVSPLSLSYYGLCLLNGNYSVKLHFMEIVITDYNGYSSPGRRIFDVYIQGKVVLKDFNIKYEANGSGKAVVKKFNTIVTQNKLEIRFYWAGKGTTGIPTSGTYGPLVSAIAVDPNFKPPSKSRKYVIQLVGILVAVPCLIILLLFVIWKKGCFRRRDSKDLKRLDLQTGSFSLRQIQAATDNFSASNKIGEGGFGSVYKGLLSDGTIIAVKQLSSTSTQGNREFLNEIGMISALQHPNLVRLYGCCVEENQLLLVYEYLDNNSLANALFGPEKYQVKLDWPTRHKICVGIARGLAYLHEESTLRIVHRDIKATNVLLDRELNPKISDFGLAKLNENENTHISTRIAGTMGYMAPEYVTRGYLTVKADVYSFGIVALEIITGKSVTRKTNEENIHLLDWAYILREKGELLMLVDKRLGLDFNKEEALRMIKVAMLCSNSSPARRPAMSMAVRMLTSDITIPDFVPDSNILHEHHLAQENRWNSYDNKSSTLENQTHPLHTAEDIDDSGTSTSDMSRSLPSG